MENNKFIIINLIRFLQMTVDRKYLMLKKQILKDVNFMILLQIQNFLNFKYLNMAIVV